MLAFTEHVRILELIRRADAVLPLRGYGGNWTDYARGYGPERHHHVRPTMHAKIKSSVLEISSGSNPPIRSGWRPNDRYRARSSRQRGARRSAGNARSSPFPFRYSAPRMSSDNGALLGGAWTRSASTRESRWHLQP